MNETVSRLEAQEGKTEDLIKIVTSLVAETRKTSGNLCDNVYQDVKTPAKLIIYGVWEGQTALKSHTAATYLVDTEKDDYAEQDCKLILL